MIFTGGEIIGRIGGDEFAVFVGDIGNIDTILMKAKLLQRAIRTVYCEEEHEICVSGSIGISLYPKDGQDYNQLMNSADKALYDVKEQGKNGYKLFT
jgi:diguanylate cyclase (GGDEF)-like protein